MFIFSCRCFASFPKYFKGFHFSFVRVKDDVDIRKGEIPADLTLLKSTQFQGYPALFKYVFSNAILLFVVKKLIES